MSRVIKMFIGLMLLGSTDTAARETVMPVSIEKKIAAMAAKDRGHSLANPLNTLLELNGPDGTEMFDGYYNIAVYVAPDGQ